MNKVAEFTVNYRQYLNENGELAESSSPLARDEQTLIDLYKIMVQTRVFDKKAIALQRTGKMGTYAPINGQEAMSSAIGHAMQPEDVFVPYYRDYAAMIQRGVKMSEILAYWGGDERGSCFENNKEDFPICVPIASQCLHATGVAFAFKHRKQARVAVVCIGEGGTSEGDFYEALNVAGAWKLPVVFVVNNNQWAISVPREKQTACQSIAQKAIAAGIEGIQIDGNDMIACRQVIGEAIEKARQGDGPTLIEGMSYRLSDHTTADDATRYQPREQVSEAEKKEPVARLRNYLMAMQCWDEAKEQQLLEDCAKQVDNAVKEYLSAEKQPVSAMFDYHFAEMPDYLIEQRAMAMEDADNA